MDIRIEYEIYLYEYFDALLLFIIVLFWQKLEKKLNGVIQLPELNQLEFDWFGFGKKFSWIRTKLNQLKFIDSDLFFPQTRPEPTRLHLYIDVWKGPWLPHISNFKVSPSPPTNNIVVRVQHLLLNDPKRWNLPQQHLWCSSKSRCVIHLVI